MRNKIVFTIFKKETLDIFRDKRMLISIIVIPLIAFPLIMIGISYFMRAQVDKVSRETLNVGYAEDPQHFKDIFSGLSVSYKNIEGMSFRDMLLEKKIDFFIKRANGDYYIYYDMSSTSNSIKYSHIEKKFSEHKNVLVKRTLAERDIEEGVLEPFRVNPVNVASEKKMGVVFLAMILPYMLIIISIGGGTSPAIDLTVGEKERGTLETLFASGTQRNELILGKYLTTVLICLITATASLTSFTFTFSMIPDSAGFTAKMTAGTFLISLLSLIPISMIFSALIFVVSTFSRSVKEAQSYIQPMMMLIIFPAMASFFPGIEPNMVNVFIPVVNLSLLLKSIILGEINTAFLLITLISSAVMAMFFIGLAFRLFDKESVIFKAE